MPEHTSVGNIGAHAGDERPQESEHHENARYHEGKKHSHKSHDSSMVAHLAPQHPFAYCGYGERADQSNTEDQRSIANRLDREEHRSDKEDPVAEAIKKDPTLAVCQCLLPYPTASFERWADIWIIN
jgi:hypothetical protein